MFRLEGTKYQTFHMHLHVVGMTVKERSTTHRCSSIMSRCMSITTHVVIKWQEVYPVAGVVSSTVPNVTSCHSSCYFHTTSLYLSCCSHQDWPGWLTCLTHLTCVWKAFILNFDENSNFPEWFSSFSSRLYISTSKNRP
jgi:hypothetical protein